MTVKITYFVHGTTTDNENHIATGWNPGALSNLGVQQSRYLPREIKYVKFQAIFSSDLARAVESARLAFPREIVKPDKRLRECNYGDLNGRDAKQVKAKMEECVEKPFPNGESYKDVENRMRDFLKFLLENYDGRHVALISHQAPQLALDVIIQKKTWPQAIKEDWRLTKAWKPGWDYILGEEMLK